MKRPARWDFIHVFRLRGLVIATAAVGIALILAGQGGYALGVTLGTGLFVLNALFLYEGGRSLLRSPAGSKVRVIAAASSAGRLLFLGMALAFAAQLGRAVLIGSCVAILAAQLHLHLPIIRRRATAR